MKSTLSQIVEQHAGEAAFLWCLRDRAVHAPQFSLESLTDLDERVEAHLDGLRVNGEPAWETCKAAVAEGEAGEVFAAAVLAFESGRDERITVVLKAGTATPEAARGLVSALGWLPYPRVADRIKQLAESDVPALRRVAVAALAVHRQPVQPILKKALADADPLVWARALRAVGELRLLNQHRTALTALSSKDAACRFWGAWSAGVLHGEQESVMALKEHVEAPGPYQERAVQVAVRRMELSAAKQWLQKLAKQPELLRVAVIGSGALGDPQMVPWLMDQMQIEPVARVAGEAFSMITGVDLAYDDLELKEAPKGFEAGPTENPEDENVAMDADENLYWPDPDLVRKWWNGHKGDFKDGTRYLVGKPITPESLPQVLATGFQRQRAAAALELAILKPGTLLFEVRAPGFRQK